MGRTNAVLVVSHEVERSGPLHDMLEECLGQSAQPIAFAMTSASLNLV